MYFFDNPLQEATKNFVLWSKACESRFGLILLLQFSLCVLHFWVGDIWGGIMVILVSMSPTTNVVFEEIIANEIG